MLCKNQKIRFINKNNNENERKLFADNWSEATQLYGTSVSYFVHTYSLTGHDAIYGEHITTPFALPVNMLVLAQLNNDSLLLSKWGISCDADLTVVIPIKDFAEAMGNPHAEPKSGDLISLDEVGWDRPGGGGYPNNYPSSQLSGVSSVDFCKLDNPDDLKSLQNTLISGGYNPFETWLRGPNVYEITERRDENIPGMMNPLMAHIVWYLKLKRFDYSYEPSAPREKGSSQLADPLEYGKIAGTDTLEPAKPYSQSVEEESLKSWDYEYTGNKDGEYGYYGRLTPRVRWTSEMVSTSASGSTATFSLERKPYDVLLVYVNGLLQKSTIDYTYNKYTLTFTYTIPAGYNIFVYYNYDSVETSDFPVAAPQPLRPLLLWSHEIVASLTTGTQSSYTLSHIPYSNTTTFISINGLLQRFQRDYTFTGTQLNFTFTVPPYYNIIAFYTYDSKISTENNIIWTQEMVTTSATGTDTTYTLAHTPNSPTSKLLVYVNGILARLGTDVTCSGNILTFSAVVPINFNIMVFYSYVIT